MPLYEIELTIDKGASLGDLLTIEIEIADGRLVIMGLMELTSDRLVIRDMHMGGVGANSLGVTALRKLGNGLLETLDVDEILIVGAARTSGANPGRRPDVVRFTRKTPAPRDTKL